jgi:hypothetical protein
MHSSSLRSRSRPIFSIRSRAARIAYGALPAPSIVLPFTMPTLFDPGSQDEDDTEESEEYSRPSTSVAGAFGGNSMKRDDRVRRLAVPDADKSAFVRGSE